MDILNKIKGLVQNKGQKTELKSSNGLPGETEDVFADIARRELAKVKVAGSLTEIFDLIRSKLSGFDYENDTMQFEVNKPISAEELREFVSLPFEISIDELYGKMILTTGKERETKSTLPTFLSKVTLHTHPERNVGGSVWPSYGDIYKTEGSNATHFVVTRKGIIKYGPPKINPVTLQLVGENDDYRDVIHAWYEKVGPDETDHERAEEQKTQFLMQSQSIEDYYEWDDNSVEALKVKEQLLAEINSVFK